MGDSYVCSGAMMKCTMGTSPAVLTVLPVRTVFLAGQPQANISDHQSMVNLAPFGLCRSLAYPATASATAAALGTLTPMPCVHNTPAPWIGGKMDYLVKGQPALLKSCKCQCMWGGTISLTTDGQVGVGTQYVQKKNKQTFNNKQKPLSPTEKNISNGFVADLSSSALSNTASLSQLAPTKRELENLLNNHPEWFKNAPFRTIALNNPNDECVRESIRKYGKGPNGYTDLKGNIHLREDIMVNCLKGIKKIQDNNKIKDETKKQELTTEEKFALGTLWHEINHNMHNSQKDSKIAVIIEFYFGDEEITTNYMETANEFVARSTFDQFYEALGGKLTVQERKDLMQLMSNRTNTGYNKWVVRFQDAIKWYGLDKEKVLDSVREGLFETDYLKQKKNLTEALVKAGQAARPDAAGVHHPTENEAARIVKRLLNP